MELMTPGLRSKLFLLPLLLAGVSLTAFPVAAIEGADVAVYADDGVWIHSVVAFGHFLDWKGLPHERLYYADVNQNELTGLYQAICFPGGDAYAYKYNITPVGHAHIRDLVAQGGAYIGICAGAFFASDRIEWEGGSYPYNLDLFAGVAVGALDVIAPWPFYSMTDISLDPMHPVNQYEPPVHTTLYYGGPAFYPDAGVEIQTFATWDAFEDAPAIIGLDYGDGRVLLLGPHPEIEEDSDRDGTGFGSSFDDAGSEWGLLWTATDWVLDQPISPPTAVPGDAQPWRPTALVLHQNYPNPFNPQTVIAFELRSAVTVDLQIFDVGGKLVHNLRLGRMYPEGRHKVLWDGRDGAGHPVPAGIYEYRLTAGNLTAARSMMMIK